MFYIFKRMWGVWLRGRSGLSEIFFSFSALYLMRGYCCFLLFNCGLEFWGRDRGGGGVGGGESGVGDCGGGRG